MGWADPPGDGHRPGRRGRFARRAPPAAATGRPPQPLAAEGPHGGQAAERSGDRREWPWCWRCIGPRPTARWPSPGQQRAFRVQSTGRRNRQCRFCGRTRAAREPPAGSLHVPASGVVAVASSGQGVITRSLVRVSLRRVVDRSSNWRARTGGSAFADSLTGQPIPISAMTTEPPARQTVTTPKPPPPNRYRPAPASPPPSSHSHRYQEAMERYGRHGSAMAVSCAGVAWPPRP